MHIKYNNKKICIHFWYIFCFKCCLLVLKKCRDEDPVLFHWIRILLSRIWILLSRIRGKNVLCCRLYFYFSVFICLSDCHTFCLSVVLFAFLVFIDLPRKHVSVFCVKTRICLRRGTCPSPSWTCRPPALALQQALKSKR